MRLSILFLSVVAVTLSADACLAAGRLGRDEKTTSQRISRPRPEVQARVQDHVRRDEHAAPDAISGRITGRRAPSQRLHANLARDIRSERRADPQKIGRNLTAVVASQDRRAAAEEEARLRRPARRRRRRRIVTATRRPPVW